MARWPAKSVPVTEPPANDAVPVEVQRVEVWHAGTQIAFLNPLPPPGVNELVLVHGQVRRILARHYHAPTFTVRLEVA